MTTEAKLTWSIWQDLLNAFAWALTRRGFHRFAEWITAMALNVEEHTITQSVLTLELPAACKALEFFAEYGSWHEGTADGSRLAGDGGSRWQQMGQQMGPPIFWGQQMGPPIFWQQMGADWVTYILARGRLDRRIRRLVGSVHPRTWWPPAKREDGRRRWWKGHPLADAPDRGWPHFPTHFAIYGPALLLSAHLRVAAIIDGHLGKIIGGVFHCRRIVPFPSPEGERNGPLRMISGDVASLQLCGRSCRRAPVTPVPSLNARSSPPANHAGSLA